MTSADLEASLRADGVAPGYLRPRYTDYSFANVPATAAAALGVDLGPTVPADAMVDVDGIERVVVVVVDGFGWAQWKRHRDALDFFRRLGTHGTIAPITTVYPSETAACLTTFHTGEPPARHGLIGWGVFVEALETVVEPLPFKTVDGYSLTSPDAPPPGAELLFDADPIYPELGATGVSVTAIQPSKIVGSPYSERVLEGSTVQSYDSKSTLVRTIREALETGPAPQYVHVYDPTPDQIAHHEGARTATYRNACSDLGVALETGLVQSLEPAVADETLLVVTADHGIVNTHPQTNVDLYAIDGVRRHLRRTKEGAVVPPSGGPRNVHLHARHGAVEPLRSLLDRHLDALVLDRDEVLEMGLFGEAEPSTLFEERVGDLLVIPNERSVWYRGNSSGLECVGMHGGLHLDEVLVPLASIRLGDLVS